MTAITYCIHISKWLSSAVYLPVTNNKQIGYSIIYFQVHIHTSINSSTSKTVYNYRL